MEYTIVEFIYCAAVFIFGLVLGSFANVVIHRVPLKESVVYPGSHCPSCGAPIRYYDNIPVVSYLLLGGSCRSCSGRISPRYPAVEFIVACMVLWLYLLHGFSVEFAGFVFFGFVLVASALIDLDHMIIPNRLTYPAMVLGLAFSLRLGAFGLFRAILGAAAGLTVLVFMAFLGRILYRRDSVGMGDFKLVLVIGLFSGPLWTAAALGMAVFFGGMTGIVQLLLKKKRADQEVPFGPFLSLGALCTLFFRPQLLFLVEQYLDLL